MANIYEGKPDDRQSAEMIPVSRFRPKYRALTDQEKALHDAIKNKAAELEVLFDQARAMRLPPVEIRPPSETEGQLLAIEAIGSGPGEYFADGMKSLELAVMWTVKGLTS